MYAVYEKCIKLYLKKPEGKRALGRPTCRW
jgi:hypothetical protein